ncbi:MAG: hypothetical protein AAB441_02940 [Patescibacteria group bacterium]
MKKVTVSLIKNFLFIFIFILILGLVLFYLFINTSLSQKPYKFTGSQLSPTPITDKKGIECEKSGGEWITGPFGKEFFCNNKMADGGKICRSNLDCLSDTCIVDEPDDVGKCASNKISFGCYTRLIKKGVPVMGRIRGGIISREKICVD